MGFDGQARTALIFGVVANAESSIRILLSYFDPKACVAPNPAFANIYDCLLRKTAFQRRAAFKYSQQEPEKRFLKKRLAELSNLGDAKRLRVQDK